MSTYLHCEIWDGSWLGIQLQSLRVRCQIKSQVCMRFFSKAWTIPLTCQRNLKTVEADQLTCHACIGSSLFLSCFFLEFPDGLCCERFFLLTFIIKRICLPSLDLTHSSPLDHKTFTFQLLGCSVSQFIFFLSLRRLQGHKLLSHTAAPLSPVSLLNTFLPFTLFPSLASGL